MLRKSLKRITAAILAASMSLNSDFIIHAGAEDEVYRAQEETVSEPGEESPSEELSPEGEINPENTPQAEESSEPTEESNSVSEEPPVTEGENPNPEAPDEPESYEIPADEESLRKVLGVFTCEETGVRFEEELDVSGELKDIASFAAYFEGYEWTGKAYLMDFEVSALSDHSFESGGEKAFGDYYGEEETPVVTFAYVPAESEETRESSALAEEKASLRVNCNYEGLDEGLDITSYVRNYLVTILGEDGLYYNDKGQSGTTDKWYLRVTPGGSATAVNLPVQSYTIGIIRGTNDGFVKVPGYQTLLIPGVGIGLDPGKETEISLTVPYRKRTQTEVHDNASIVYKQDSNRAPLNGAEFTLYADEALSKPVKVFTTAGEDGSFAIATNDEALRDYLPTGDGEEHKTQMYLKETKSPADYEPREDVYSFIITRSTIEYLKNDVYVINTYYYPSFAEKQPDGSYSYTRNKYVFNHLTVTGVSVKVIWDDDNNRDYLRPRELRPKLLANGEETGKSALLYAGNEWTSSINDLPKYKDGQEIDYTWSEAEIEGYEQSSTAKEGTVTSLTNTHTPELTEATVKKVLDDGDNQDGLRPEALKVTLSDGSEVTLNEANGWTGTVAGLPKYKDGQKIEYTWSEDTIEGYELKETTEGTVTTLTNTHTPELTEATVRKVWNDNNNQDGKRPSSLKVTLSSGTEVTLNEAGDWTATVKDLPKYDKGQEITYTWTEETVEGYELTGNTTEGTVTTLTNTHTPETVETTVTKIWDDDNNRDGRRPESLTFTLSNGMTATLSEENRWSATIKDLPKYEDGKEIDYRWNEGEVPEGYSITSVVTEGTTVTFTDSYAPGKVSSGVRKVWDDDDNRDGMRPAGITAVLMKNGEEFGSYELNDANEWRTIVTDLDKYDEGIENEYTWEEKSVPEGYTAEEPQQSVNLTILRNVHVPETTEATVKKVWDDNNDQDGIRPETLKVTLSEGSEMTLSEANGWTGTVVNLPKYDKGQMIDYTWSEETIEGYEPSGMEKDGTVTTLTNTHTPETTEATVKKVWEDDNNRDGKRPEALKVTLSEGSEVTLSEANDWSGTVTDLPKYDKGQVIDYTWSEETVKGYEMIGNTTEGTVTTLTNVHTPETTEATVQKVWNDNNNQDGKRPSSLKVTLSDGREFELSANNSWTRTVLNLPKYKDGKEIDYTWSEETIEGYELSRTTEGTVTTLTNTHTPETTEATVKKVWDDNNNQDGIRPAIITAVLKRNGETMTSYELSERNDWSAVAANLPEYSEGVKNDYTWEETSVPAGYTSGEPEKSGKQTVITNVHVPEETSASVKKIWEDGNNQDGKRPASLKVTLSSGSEVTLNEANDWSAVIEHLPKYRSGEEIEYTWSEETVEGYELTGNTKEGTVTTLTNTHTPETTEATVNVIWDDNNNQDGRRPASLQVSLRSTLTRGAKSVTLTEENAWTATIYDLPRYAEGREIIYSWSEEAAEGYERTNTSVSGTLTSITLTHVPEKTQATVQKVWNDNSDQDGKRPASLKVTLSSGEEVTLDVSNQWTATVTDLPKYREGTEINYTWTEDTIEGYELTGNTKVGTVTTLTNTHTPEKTEATVKKVWDDNNDETGKRPASVVMNLLKNGEVLRTVTLSESGLWSETVTGLDRYEKGKEAVYTWEEKVIPEGYAPDQPKKEGTVTTITNRRVRGALIISKKLLDGLDDDRDKKFEFTVVLGTALSGTYGEIVFENGKASVSLKGGESVMAENLPTGISYTVTEKQGPGYELTEKKGDTGVIGETASLASFVNQRITGSLTVVKTWSGGSHEKDSVEVTLYQNGNEFRKVVLNRACGWTNEWTNLPGYDISGNEYEYLVKETKGKEGYTANYPDGNRIMFHSCGESKKIRILNREDGPEQEESDKRKDEPVIVSGGTVRLIRNDNNNSGGTRPNEVVLYLYADGRNTGIRIVLSEQNGWTYSFANLPLFRPDGTLIQYTLKEDPLTNYGIQITGDPVHGFYVYNTLKSGIPNTRDPFHTAGFGLAAVISLLAAAVSGMMLKRFG